MKHQKLLLQIGAIFIASILAFWIGLVVFLPGMVKKSVHHYGQSIGHHISYESIDVSPWNLKVDIHGLKLSKESEDKNPLLHIQHLSVNAELIHLLIARVHLSEVTIDQAQIFLLRTSNKQGVAQWNFLELIKSIQALKKSDAKPSNLKIEIDQFQLKNSQISIKDSIKKTDYVFKDVEFQAKEFANYAPTGVQGVQSDYLLNLKNVDLAIPGSANRLKLSSLGVGGHLDMIAQEKIDLKINLSVEDSKLTSTLSYDLKKADLDGSVSFKDLPLAPFVALLPANEKLVTEKGSVSAELKLKTNPRGWAILGDLDFAELAIYEPKEKDPLLSWKKAYFSKFELDFLEKEQKRFSIQELVLTQPLARFSIGEDKFSNFRRLFMKNQAVTSPAPATKTPSTPAVLKVAGKPAFEVDIKAIKVNQGRMYFSDASIRPGFKTNINNLNGSLLGVSNVPGQYATIALDGAVDKSGSLRARGQAAFEDPRRNSDVSLSFKNLPLHSINPYAMTFAGYQIDDGRIDVDLRYTAKDGQLLGKNRFVIRKIKLGEEVPDFKGVRLPIGLAIAVLEDSDGMIDVNIPIKGNVDSPEFSVGHLFWQALRNVLSSIVTAPFRALASLFGEEGLDGIYTAPGESVITPPEQEKLEKVAKLLEKKANAVVEFYGTYDPQIDRQELARVNADRAILLAAGFKLKDTEPLPNPSLSDPRVQSGLKSAYGSQVGRIKLAQQLIRLPNTPERWETLRKELIQAQNINEARLIALANARANNARDAFLKSSPEMKDRVRVGKAQEVKAEDAGIPLGISLISK
ncbi:DUF748 domain-containing protein [Polynucleobacter cosmopolitanus]|uniref:Uncharacterized protein n=1 Tax=Polynucleobacter cosmopolitanus TaxID=351345 RepID=A0A229FS29_9BURK|nr:DUF748 domain-containing protein [Polynucleobacter cosmopolitanus]OXL14836.1 hypothetical protein AOC33_05805 [Polynucleobacter cosmopolitanus]